MSTVAVFRWYWREPSVTHRSYAEAELANLGRTDDARFYASVYLVRDEMPKPDGRSLIDPDQRVGVRVYVGACHDEAVCRRLEFLASVEGAREAYSMIWRVLVEHPDHVKRFGDEWLAAAICRRANYRQRARDGYGALGF